MARPVIVCTESSVNFRQQLGAVAQAENVALIWSTTVAAWTNALDRWFPTVALIDLDRVSSNQPTHSGQLDQAEESELKQSPQGRERVAGQAHPLERWTWQTHLRRIKLRPHTRHIPVVAFSRGNEATLAQAHQLGADQIWHHDELIPKLGDVVHQYLYPPVRYPDGWDEPLPLLAREGLRLFNARDYFEQHELLEEAWRAEARLIRVLYQGILQIGVAFYQIELGNWHGAVKMFRRGLPKLRDLPAQCQGVKLAEFRAVAEKIHADVTSLGPAGLADFDRGRFPQIDYS